MIGGWLANSYIKFGIAGPEHVFEKFPYLLSCLVTSALNLLIFLAGCGMLKETNQVVRFTRDNHNVEITETQPLLIDPLSVLEVLSFSEIPETTGGPAFNKTVCFCIAGAT